MTYRFHSLAALHRPGNALGVAADEGAAVCQSDKGKDGESVVYEHAARGLLKGADGLKFAGRGKKD